VLAGVLAAGPPSIPVAGSWTPGCQTAISVPSTTTTVATRMPVARRSTAGLSELPSLIIVSSNPVAFAARKRRATVRLHYR